MAWIPDAKTVEERCTQIARCTDGMSGGLSQRAAALVANARGTGWVVTHRQHKALVRLCRDLTKATKFRFAGVFTHVGRRAQRTKKMGVPSKPGRKNYSLYLRSHAWANRRKAAIGAQHTCSHCGSSSDLQVHHLSYERLGEELPTDLMVLCKNCHEAVHGWLDWNYPGRKTFFKIARTSEALAALSG